MDAGTADETTPSEEVFELVTDELSRLLEVAQVRTVRLEPDGTVTVLATRVAGKDRIPTGTNVPIPRGTVIDQVFRTGGPAPGSTTMRVFAVRSVPPCRPSSGLWRRRPEVPSSSTGACGARWWSEQGPLRPCRREPNTVSRSSRSLCPRRSRTSSRGRRWSDLRPSSPRSVAWRLSMAIGF
jgi:hypothetical protein